MNQVESWFGYLTDQKIRRGVHESVQALETGIRAWIKTGTRIPVRSAGRKPPTRSSPHPPNI